MKRPEDLVDEKMSDYDGQSFLYWRNRNGQTADNLVSEATELIAKYNLSVTVANGFLDFMKLVIADRSTLPPQK